MRSVYSLSCGHASRNERADKLPNAAQQFAANSTVPSRFMPPLSRRWPIVSGDRLPQVPTVASSSRLQGIHKTPPPSSPTNAHSLSWDFSSRLESTHLYSASTAKGLRQQGTCLMFVQLPSEDIFPCGNVHRRRLVQRVLTAFIQDWPHWQHVGRS